MKMKTATIIFGLEERGVLEIHSGMKALVAAGQITALLTRKKH
ncbi:MAG: hypothetical protein WCI27_05215 [Candidatus Omnitrophota bacterium]